MPRRSTAEKFEKVVSAKIAVSDFELLEEYARIEYNEYHITQPTISMMLRLIITRWAKSVNKKITSQIELDTRKKYGEKNIPNNRRNDVTHYPAQIELETGEEYDYEKGGVKKKNLHR
jgi:hypothetical protein